MRTPKLGEIGGESRQCDFQSSASTRSTYSMYIDECACTTKSSNLLARRAGEGVLTKAISPEGAGGGGTHI